jgi:hypothetical protein
MSRVNLLGPNSVGPLIEKFGDPSATLARLAHINELQEELANAVPYYLIGARLNHPLGQPPTIAIVGRSQAAPCPVGCDCSIGRDITCFTLSNFAVGKYTITMSVPPANGFDILISPLKDARQNIGIEKVSSTEIIVSVYDIPSGSYVDNAFDNTYIQFMLWN